MFIAWRSVTEAKNTILFLCYLSYVCVCVSVYAIVRTKPIASRSSTTSSHTRQAMAICHAIFSKQRWKLNWWSCISSFLSMQMYFFRGSAYYLTALLLLLLMLVLFFFFYDGRVNVFCCRASNLCAIPCLFYEFQPKNKNKRERKQRNGTLTLNV